METPNTPFQNALELYKHECLKRSELYRHIKWLIQTIHNVHHDESQGAHWTVCTRGLCLSTRHILLEAA